MRTLTETIQIKGSVEVTRTKGRGAGKPKEQKALKKAFLSISRRNQPAISKKWAMARLKLSN